MLIVLFSNLRLWWTAKKSHEVGSDSAGLNVYTNVLREKLAETEIIFNQYQLMHAQSANIHY